MTTESGPARYTLIHTAAFAAQLLAIDAGQVPGALRLVEQLRATPQPDGDARQAITGYRGAVFRLRERDLRIVYTFDDADATVRLLGVDLRPDTRRGGVLVAGAGPVATVAEISDWLTPSALPPARDVPTTPLPAPITAALLAALRIEPRWHAALTAGATLEALVAAPVPDGVRDRVFDALLEPDFGQATRQPAFETGASDDLLRYRQGDLLEFLLHLSDDQRRVAAASLHGAGPVLVRGGPGTGKSLVAMYRARFLAQELTRPNAPPPRILFTTYTTALVSVSRQLLDRLLGSLSECVEVETVDRLAYQIAGRPANLIKGTDQQKALREALAEAEYTGDDAARHAQAQAVEQLGLDCLLEEINDIIESYQIANQGEYLTVVRPVGAVALTKLQRSAVWQVYRAYTRQLAAAHVLTFEQLRRQAVDLVQGGRWPKRYDAVIIDEAQDLSPAAVRLLVELCATPGRLFLTADAEQTIYRRAFRWSEVHELLQFRGRTRVLRLDYRMTHEIATAALAYLVAGERKPDVKEPVAMQSGPLPAMRLVASRDDEIGLLTSYLPQATQALRLGIGAAAVLCPTNDAAAILAQRLTSAGVAAITRPDLAAPAVKVLTIHSAKGMEFPVVALAGFVETGYPFLPGTANATVRLGALRRERRLIYVGMTRAMRALLVLVPRTSTGNPLFTGFAAPQWNLE